MSAWAEADRSHFYFKGYIGYVLGGTRWEKKMSYDAVSFLGGLFSEPNVPVVVNGEPPTQSGEDDPVVIHAEVRGDELILHCPSPEIAAAIEAGRDELEAAINRIGDASQANDWPGDAVDAGEPCPRCGSLDKWWDLWGGEHCVRCEWTKVDRSQRLASRARFAKRVRDPPENCQTPVQQNELVAEREPAAGPEERLEQLTDEERAYYEECVDERRKRGERESGLPWRALVDVRMRSENWK